jgi:hypothetical protein
MPFTTSQIDEVQRTADGPDGRVYDVAMPYRRLGRCRVSDAAGAVIGIECADVAVALTSYEERNGKHGTASELLGAGVNLGVEDAAVSRR